MTALYKKDPVTLIEWTRASEADPWTPVREDHTTRVEDFAHAVTLTKFMSERQGVSSPAPSSHGHHHPLTDDVEGRAELAKRIERLCSAAAAIEGDERLRVLAAYRRDVLLAKVAE